MLIKKCKHLIEVVSNQSQLSFGQQTKNNLRPPHLQHRPTYSFAMIFGVMSMVLPFNCVDAVGYSYTRFIGPVAGPERKVFVNDAITGIDANTQIRGSVDYVGKPEYEFAYGVEDADAHILHNRNEMRDGDAVKGVYSLIDPDGTLRVVRYTADEINGFQAEIIRNGISSLHGQLQQDYIHAPPSKTVYNNFNLNPHYNPQSQPPQTHYKEDSIVDYPSSNTYKSNVVRLPPNKHATPPQQPINYQYNKNYHADVEDEDGDVVVDANPGRDDDGDYDGRGNESEDRKPHYEVHERPKDETQENQDQRPQYKVHEKPDEDSQEMPEDHVGYKSNNHDKVSSQKIKTQHLDEGDDDDDDDDEDYDDVNESEEVDDYEESYEYY